MLGRKFQIQTAVLALVACSLVLVGFALATHTTQTTVLKVGRASYTLEIAANDGSRGKGLGGRSSMPANHGMLFVYPNAAVRCFWMKDMHFPLDMIWLSPSKQVQYVAADVPPSSYPSNFCPGGSAQYVIELNAGQAAAAGIVQGQRLHF